MPPIASSSAGCSVTANDRTVIHRTSLGYVLSFPDMCLTPDKNGPPVPYTNAALSADVVDCCTSVYCDGNLVAHQDSAFNPSYGDEAGNGGGIFSGCNKGKATFIHWSGNVLFEGKGAVRHLELMGANHMSPPNIFGIILQLIIKVGLRETLCIAFCACNHKFLKMSCFRPVFADQVSAHPDFGFWLGGYYDSRVPGVWLEVPYDMTRKPPTMMSSDVDSQYQKDASKAPLKVPATWWQSWGSTIPDVVEAKNPDAPPTDKDNIKNVYELKFDNDRERPGQFAKQRQIAEARRSSTCSTRRLAGARSARSTTRTSSSRSAKRRPCRPINRRCGRGRSRSATSSLPWKRSLCPNTNRPDHSPGTIPSAGRNTRRSPGCIRRVFRSRLR